MTVPCSCCPTNTDGCFVIWEPALRQLVLTGAHIEVFTGGPGITPIGGVNSPVGLLRWSDGDVTGVNFTGYTSPAIQLTAITSPIIVLEFQVPQDRVRGLREWNQGGGDLGDLDGFSSWTVEFRDSGGAVLATGSHAMGNGGAPFDFLLPGATFVNGVKSVRLSDMRKLNPGATTSPLVREVEVLTLTPVPVFPCRTPDGLIHWFDASGAERLAADVVPCSPA